MQVVTKTPQVTSKSFFSSVEGLQHLLEAPQDLLEITVEWNFQTPEQKKLEAILNSLKKINFPELEKIAELGGVKKVNKFLRDHGMDIQLDSIGADGVAAAIVFKITSKWVNPGKESYMFVDNKDVPAIDFAGQYIYQTTDQYTFTVLELENGDSLLVTLPTEEDEKRIYEGTYLHQMGRGMLNSYLGKNFHSLSNYGGLRMPKIDIRQQRDLSEILGLTDNLNGYIVSQALGQFLLQINEEGLKVKVAMAMAMEKGVSFDSTPYLELDKNFCAFLVRDKELLFAGYLTPDSWGEPKIHF